MADVSVGTVDRVLHGRGSVSTDSRRRVEEVLQRLDYHPNVYASMLASNRQYLFCCLLPQHGADEYWSEVELGIHDARQAYADFNLTVTLFYYDPYDYHSFGQAACRVAACVPDGVVLAPTAPQHTKAFTDGLAACGIPFIYISIRTSRGSRPCRSSGRTRIAAAVWRPVCSCCWLGRKLRRWLSFVRRTRVS